MNETGASAAAGLDIEALRAAYETGKERPDDVAKRFGITRQKLAVLARRYGWRAPVRPRIRKRTATRHELSLRLRGLVEAELGDIEARIGEDRPSTDRERDARRISVLVRALERLGALIREAEAEAERGKAKDEGALRDAIERKLARLAGQGREEAGS